MTADAIGIAMRVMSDPAMRRRLDIATLLATAVETGQAGISVRALPKSVNGTNPPRLIEVRVRLADNYPGDYVGQGTTLVDAFLNALDAVGAFLG